jgi:pimeloyl-ACP methyl ester carboxylesterase
MKPVLLLIPGMLNTGAIWDAVRADLEPTLDVRVADVLTQDSIPAMAADAWALVADLPTEARLTVCGFSMGGYVAIELLARHRDRVQAVALVDSAAAIETAETLPLREKTIGALERNFARTVEGIIPFSLHPNSLANTAWVDGMRRMMHEVGAATAIRQTRAVMARTDHRAMLARLTQPVLVVCGRGDKVTPPPLSQELADLIPQAQLVWFDEAGHQTPIEQAPALAQLLLRLALSARPKQELP